jgi:hypothetical protein
LFGTILLGSVLVFPVGKTGFHFHDLSIAFDGGYRILKGQLPFVDFFSPIGPVLFIQQAAFFALFGVTINAYLLHGAFLNAVAALVAYSLLRRFDRTTAVVGAAVTSFWFFLPPGAPYIDTTALFWAFVGVLALTQKREPSSPKGFYLFAAGVCVGLSFLTKQNVGAFAIVLGGLLTVFNSGGRSLLSYWLGVSVPLALFLFYLVLVDGLTNYSYYALTVPLEIPRLQSVFPQAGKLLWNALRPDAYRTVSWPEFSYELVFYTAIAWLIWTFLGNRTQEKRELSLVIGALLLLQNLSRDTSRNDWELYFPFIGVALAGFGFLIRRPTRRYVVVLSLLGLVVAAYGYRVSASRQAHGGIRVPVTTYVLKHPRLSNLRVDADSGRALDELLLFLDRNVAADDPIFIYPYQTILYGALAKIPPQPLLWFAKGVSYSAYDSSKTDSQIVNALRRQNVHWIVIEKNLIAMVDDFPQLQAYLNSDFREAHTIRNRYILYFKA